MTIYSMTDVDLVGKRVLIRLDLNVPMGVDGITSDTRIQAALPTIRAAVKADAKIMLLSHLEQSSNATSQVKPSLRPIASRLQELLQQPVRFVSDWLNGVELGNGQIALAENVRFNSGEMSNDPVLSQRMAALCDVFVMDAFGSAHRAHASTCGIVDYAPLACAGPLLAAELQALDRAWINSSKPLAGIIGGAKIATKLDTMLALTTKLDQLLLGGGIANTFIAVSGQHVGKSLYEPNRIDQVHAILQSAQKHGCKIWLPVDVVVTSSSSLSSATATNRRVSAIKADDRILDIGPETVERYTQIIRNVSTVIWSGPVGAFEFAAFANGTRSIATAIAQSKAFSIAGGGDTLAAIECLDVVEPMDYISTGGGAFLTYLEGKTLPAVAALMASITATPTSIPVSAAGVGQPVIPNINDPFKASEFRNIADLSSS